MNSTELLAHFRYEVSDEEAPYLWSDSAVYSWIDEAQKQFCRDSYGIESARQFKLNIAVASQWYTVNPLILKLRNAINQATGADVPLIPVEKMASYGMRFDGAVGPIQALITGLEKGKLRAYPVPNATAVVELWTFRLSEDIGAATDFEIDPQHVLNLLPWVKYRAYSVHDSEVYDPARAEKYKATFAGYCARALLEQSRLNHTAGSVVYGGI